MKTKAIQKLEDKMSELDFNSVRHSILENAKTFKTSWLMLGQALFTVWNDKLFKDWGYSDFEAYTQKEVGIKKPTAIKLLRSYQFLEKEEPSYVKKSFYEDKNTNAVPTFESIDLLRKAHSKKELEKEDYRKIRNDVLEKGKSTQEVKKDLTALIKAREELSPQEERQKRRLTVLKRFLGTLRSLETEMKVSKLGSQSILVDINALLKKIEVEIN